MKKVGKQGKQLRKTEAEWEWRKRYRVWDANRKIFLYPENWIEPELRLPTRFRVSLGEVVAFICAKCGAETKRKPIRRPTHRKGVRVLLTGKNRIGAADPAQTLARDLEKTCHVDLGAVVSKYIGETEKNLRRVFAAARKSGAILFSTKRMRSLANALRCMIATTVTPISRSIISSRESRNALASRFSPPAIALTSTTRSRDGFVSLSPSRHEENASARILY
jgi:hypothetical protein